MPPIVFPATPTVGDVHRVGQRAWRWDGGIWVVERGVRTHQVHRISAQKASGGSEKDVWFDYGTPEVDVKNTGTWEKVL